MNDNAQNTARPDRHRAIIMNALRKGRAACRLLLRFIPEYFFYLVEKPFRDRRCVLTAQAVELL
jgi:hypothetical protein